MTQKKTECATPRPWKLGTHGMIYDTQCALGHRLIAHANDKAKDFDWEANAALIVKAVNNHEAVVEACKLGESMTEILAGRTNNDPFVKKALKSIRQAIHNATKE